MEFIGSITRSIITALLHPSRFRWGQTSNQVELSGVNAKIVKQPKRTIIGSKSFEHIVQIKDIGDINSIVIAFDTATGKVLKRLVGWTLVTVND